MTPLADLELALKNAREALAFAKKIAEARDDQPVAEVRIDFVFLRQGKGYSGDRCAPFCDALQRAFADKFRTDAKNMIPTLEATVRELREKIVVEAARLAGGA